MIPSSVTPTYFSDTSSAGKSEGVIRGWDTEESSGSISDIDLNSLGKNDFLKLLLAQMQHQDPLNPADNTEFVAQLAQFSSLEQMTSMNTNLEASLKSNSAVAEAVNNAMLVSYFGKEVTASSNEFMFDGASSTDLTFTSDGDISKGTLTIQNQDGVPVYEFALDGLREGENTIAWNGITKNGGMAKPGKYSFSIDAYDVLDERVETSTSFTGVVDGLAMKDGTAHLRVGGVLIPFENVNQITEADE